MDIKANFQEVKERHFFTFISLLFLFACFVSGFYWLKGTGNISIAGFLLPGFKFVAIYIFSFSLSILVFLFFPGKNENHRVFIIILLSVFSRFLLSFQEPSDDVYRYIWEGMVFKEGFNPYILSPDNPVLKELSLKFSYHSMINHRDISAVYPPMIILLFSFTAFFSKSVLIVKLISITFDFLSVIILLKILEDRKTDIRWAVLYALNPLVLYSFSGGAHIDSLQIFFLLLSLHLFDRKRWISCFVSAGLAVQVKYVAVLAVPFLIKRENLKFVPFFIFTSLIFFLPFSGENNGLMVSGLQKFYSGFAFNGPVHTLFRFLTSDMELATSLTRGLFVILYPLMGIRIFLERKDPVKGIFFSFGLLLLLTPTLHIWYICWILPFAVIRHVSSWIVLTFFSCFYYLTLSLERSGLGWSLPDWAFFMEWSLFFCFFIFELYYSVLRLIKKNSSEEKTETIAVIIPVLNEEKMIERCIDSVKNDPSLNEIIVADGGSVDKTRENALKKGAKVVINDKGFENGGGRGGQIKTGLKACKSDLAVIVHADTFIEEDLFTNLKIYMNRNRDVTGGAVGSFFEGSGMKIVETLNIIRAVFFGISFGDQIQFFRTRKIIKEELFPDVPLMEDVELSLRLPKHGRTVYLFGNSKVSNRRWKKRGISNFFEILSIFILYLLKRLFVMPDTVSIYRKYYGKK